MRYFFPLNMADGSKAVEYERADVLMVLSKLVSNPEEVLKACETDIVEARKKYDILGLEVQL